MKNQYVLRRCPMRDLKPGMETGRPLFSESGADWLAEGTVLSQELIQRIEKLGFGAVIIREYPIDQSELEHDVEPLGEVVDFAGVDLVESPIDFGAIDLPEPPIDFEIAESELHTSVLSQYDQMLMKLQRLYSLLRLNRGIDVEDLQEAADQILAWTFRGSFITNFLHLAPPREDYLPQHSVHVAAISGVIGRLLNLSEQHMHELVLCGLVHDVGYAAIPADILNKKEALLPEELELIRSHPAKGYKLLEKAKLPTSVLYGVLQHHERIDGSGYPSAIGERRIHLYAKVVGVADVYAAMTSKRAYREKISPFSVMRTLNGEMLGRLDPTSSTAFLEYLSESVLGDIVKLSDGTKAQVVYWHPGDSQPVVRTEKGKFIDLSRDTSRIITEIVGA